MPYFYTDPAKESDPHALPDVEVWYETSSASRDPLPWFSTAGYYYAFGEPGCLWDSDPVGPFGYHDEALAAAREGFESEDRIETGEFTIWVAEATNGKVQFDAEPSLSDVRNCCEDLEGKIDVYTVTCTESNRELYLTLQDWER